MSTPHPKKIQLFLQPYHQKQYNELYYLRMADPQETSARKDR